MNVIISNERQAELADLDIEVIKAINGVYEADELVSMFSNFFFGRMILDLTAIKDYKDVRNLQKFAMSLDVEKMIVLLPDTPECLTPTFLSRLISMGIYNFTTNLDGVKYLLDNPNTVAHLHQIDQETVVQQTAAPVAEQAGDTVIVNNVIQAGPTILGIKNITEHSGATMLTFMLKNQIKNMGKSCIAIEVGKRDFVFFNDKEMISVDKDGLAGELLKHRDANVILVDLNRDGDESVCNDVLHLLEPSTLKLNKLMLSNRNVFTKLEGRKIVINQNIMGDADIKQLEMEANFKAFYVLPPLDERSNNSEILEDVLNRVGINNY